MNLNHTFAAALICGSVAALSPVVGRAQSAEGLAQLKRKDPVVAAQQLANFRAAVANAHDLALAGRIGPAEAALTAVNHAKPNTAEWHIETAQRLVQAADQMVKENQSSVVSALVARAIQHLGVVDRLTEDSTLRANARTLTGFIQERYLGDPEAAALSYRSAAEFAPDDKRAAEVADRMKRTVDALHLKSAGK